MGKSETFFTRKRVRGHATLLAIVVWTLYAASLTHPGLRDWLGQVKGTDFVHEYVLGKIALQHNASLLYDYDGQVKLSHEVIPTLEDESYLPVYGPQVSLIYAPFATFSYLLAAALWMCFSAAIYALCCYAVWKTAPSLQTEGSTITILAVAFPGFFSMIAYGQNSAIAMAAFTLAWLALRSNKLLLAGMALGLLIYKPQFGIVAAVIFILAFNWRIICGGLITAVAQIGIGAAYYGKASIVNYAHTLQNLRQNTSLLEPKLFQMYSLRSFWQMLLPLPRTAFTLYVISALVVLVMVYKTWRSAAPLSFRYAAFLIATVLVDPHLTSYDLVVLAPAFILIGDWILSNRDAPKLNRFKWLLYLSFALPVFGPAIRDLRVQLAVPIFFLLLAAVTKYSSRTPRLQNAATVDGFPVPE